MIKLDQLYHRNAKHIGIFFSKEDYTEDLKRCLRSVGARFTRTHCCFYVSYSRENYYLLLEVLGPYGVMVPAKKVSASLSSVAGHGVRENLPIVREDVPTSISVSSSVFAGDKHAQQGVDGGNENHKSPCIKAIAKDMKIRCETYMGKYWMLYINYSGVVAKALKGVKGVYWNKTHKCYMVMRNYAVKRRVEDLLGREIFPTNYYRKGDAVFLGKRLVLKAYAPDERLLRLYVEGGDTLLIHQLKRISGYRYSPSLGCCLYPATPAVVEALRVLFADTGLVIVDELPKAYLKGTNCVGKRAQDIITMKNTLMDRVPVHVQGYIVEMADTIIAMNYSSSTLRTYTYALIDLLRYYDYRAPEDLKRREIVAYMSMLVQRGFTSSSLHNTLNGLKFYCMHVLGWKKFDFEIPSPKREKRLPVVLTKAEVKEVFAKVGNAKHKLLLLMAYAAGLRVSEVIALRWEDIDFELHKIHIKQAKGKKDRMVTLAFSLVRSLQQYRSVNAESSYVFEGQIKGQPYSANSARAVLKKAISETLIDKKVSMHSLRHSFATHLLEGGTDIRFIQELLGHSSIKTTTIYTHVAAKHVSRIISPLDTLGLEDDGED